MRLFLTLIAVLWSGQAPALEIVNDIMDVCPSPPPREFRQKPTVEYDVSDWPVDWLGDLCFGDGSGVTVPAGATDACMRREYGVYSIYLRNDFTPFERWCAIEHEKGHLPPNNWRH